MKDTTGDGRVDTMLEDTTGDGKLDKTYVDSTGDGHLDKVTESARAHTYLFSKQKIRGNYIEPANFRC